MTIKRTQPNQSLKDAQERLSDNDQELQGGIEQGTFNLNEVDQLYSDLLLNRKFKRNIEIGHTSATFANWVHLRAEGGYSIWKYPLADFAHNVLNRLYFDDKLVVYRGEANNEAITAFDKIFDYQGSLSTPAYNDITSDMAQEGETEQEILRTTEDYLYIGSASKFTSATFDFHTLGSGYGLKFEYYQEGVTPAWAEIASGITPISTVTDDTDGFISGGRIYWDSIDDWIKTTINGKERFWIRVSTLSSPVVIAKPYSILPGTSVPTLLKLNTDDAINQRWNWCSYGEYIFVTIQNAGDEFYLGNIFIRGSSSASAREDYFVFSHEYKADYEDINWIPNSATVNIGSFAKNQWTTATRPYDENYLKIGLNTDSQQLEILFGTRLIILMG